MCKLDMYIIKNCNSEHNRCLTEHFNATLQCSSESKNLVCKACVFRLYIYKMQIFHLKLKGNFRGM